MATTGTPGEIKKCDKCGTPARIMSNGKIRGHWDVKEQRMCNG